MNPLEQHAIDLLRCYEANALNVDMFDKRGYFLGFSGGKDSVVIKELARMSGVKFTAHYSETTIDPPELTRFIRSQHPDVEWIRPGRSFFRAFVETHGCPTRRCRSGPRRVCLPVVREPCRQACPHVIPPP